MKRKISELKMWSKLNGLAKKYDMAVSGNPEKKSCKILFLELTG
jgi:hypothetical protein